MLASKFRLKKRINFARCEIDGTLIQYPSFGVEIYDRKDNLNSRFGFIISTKISKKAVIRNKIKRIISEKIRMKLPDVKAGLDVVFLVKPSILRLEREEIEKEISNVLIKNLQK